MFLPSNCPKDKTFKIYRYKKSQSCSNLRFGENEDRGWSSVGDWVRKTAPVSVTMSKGKEVSKNAEKKDNLSFPLTDLAGRMILVAKSLWLKAYLKAKENINISKPINQFWIARATSSVEYSGLWVIISRWTKRSIVTHIK